MCAATRIPSTSSTREAQNVEQITRTPAPVVATIADILDRAYAQPSLPTRYYTVWSVRGQVGLRSGVWSGPGALTHYTLLGLSLGWIQWRRCATREEARTLWEREQVKKALGGSVCDSVAIVGTHQSPQTLYL